MMSMDAEESGNDADLFACDHIHDIDDGDDSNVDDDDDNDGDDANDSGNRNEPMRGLQKMIDIVRLRPLHRTAATLL
jgi:hypothetical protein